MFRLVTIYHAFEENIIIFIHTYKMNKMKKKKINEEEKLEKKHFSTAK